MYKGEINIDHVSEMYLKLSYPDWNHMMRESA
jgi:hypothetical protein